MMPLPDILDDARYPGSVMLDLQPGFRAQSTDMASRLMDGERGLLVLGGPRQGEAAIAIVEARLEDAIDVVHVSGRYDDRVRLRQAIARACAGDNAACRTLLAIREGDSLDGDILRDLDLVAQRPGVQFLLVAGSDVRKTFRAQQCFALAAMFEDLIQLPPMTIFGAGGAVDARQGAGRRVAPGTMAAALLMVAIGAFVFAVRSGTDTMQHDSTPSFARNTTPRFVAAPAGYPTQDAPLPGTLARLDGSIPGLAAMLPSPAPVAAAYRTSLLLLAGPGDTLPSLYQKVYAGKRAPSLAVVVAINPKPFRTGMPLVFPAPVDGWRSP